MKRIVCKDNFNREHISEFFVSEPLPDALAEFDAGQMNDREGEHSPNFYKAVPEDYKLYVWEP